MNASVKWSLAATLLMVGFATGGLASTPPTESSEYIDAATIRVNTAPSKVSRLVAANTPVTVTISVTPVNFKFSGVFTATATDPYGLFQQAVAATPTRSGGYLLDLTVATDAVVGNYSGEITIELCADKTCTRFQRVRKLVIPFNIDVLSNTSPWNGNHLSPLAAWSGVPDWTMFQGNAAHTGYVPVKLDPNRFATRWQGPNLPNPADSYNSYFDGPNTITTSNGHLYVAFGSANSSPGPALYAYRELDGSLVWQYNFNTLQFPSVNPPAVANGIVYIAAGQQESTYLFAFKASDGSLVFKSQISSQWEHYLAPAIGSKGVYTNAGTYGGLFGFDFTGKQLFFAPLPQTSMWAPAVDSHHVYTYTDVGLSVFDPVTGIESAAIADPTFTNYIYEIGGSAVLGASGSVFAANYANSSLNGGGIGNTLIHFDLTQQKITWKVPGDYPLTPAYHGGVVYAVNNNPVRVEGRSEKSGTLVWSWTPPQAGDTQFASEVLLTDDILFVSTNLATYAVDLARQKTIWSYPMVGRLALSRNGVLYIQGQGPLVAINVK
jgi:hypothetical protein